MLRFEFVGPHDVIALKHHQKRQNDIRYQKEASIGQGDVAPPRWHNNLHQQSDPRDDAYKDSV